MTEDEARAKWCPFSRLKIARTAGKDTGPVCDEPQATFNRIFISGQQVPWIPDAGRCIGSACMAWRGRVVTPLGGDDYHEGFCGLAGAPQ